MELVFLSSGQEVNKQGESIKRSVVVNTTNAVFLIDCNSKILEVMQNEKIPGINFIILTRKDEESLKGIIALNSYLKEHGNDKINLYLEKDNFDYFSANSVNLLQFNVKLYQKGVNFEINKITFEPFKLMNGEKEITCVRFLDIVYSEGVLTNEESGKYYKNANLVIHNLDHWFGETDELNNVAKALQFSKQIKSKEFIFTGTSCKPTTQSLSELTQYCQEIQNNDTKVMVAEPGLRLTLLDHVSQVLCEAREGINLRSPQCSQICFGEKTLIVDAKLYKNKAGKFVYLLEEGLCYGVIRLKVPSKMNLEEFVKLEDKHKITEKNRERWWKNKEVLFSYGFDIVELFEVPRTVCVNNPDKTFIDDFKFIKTEFIVDDYLKDYKSANLTEDILYRDLRVINSLYTTYDTTKKVKLSMEELIVTSKKIYNELTIRGREFDKFKMQPMERELFKLSHEKYLNKPPDIDLLDSIKDNPVIKHCVSLASNSKDGTLFSGVVDVIINMHEPNEVVKNIITNILHRELNRNNLNFIWGEPDKPHEVYVPLYELQLKRVSPCEIHRLKNNVIISSMFEPFGLMYPAQSFSKLTELTEHMFKTGDKFILEGNTNGTPVILIKSGTNIKLYSKDKIDISSFFKTILLEAKSLTQKDIVLIGELNCANNTNDLIEDYISGKSNLDESFVTFISSDILHFDKDISSELLYERKSKLHSLNFTNQIKEVNNLVVDSVIMANRMIPLLNSMNNSLGVTIKQWNTRYHKNSNSINWMNYKLTADATTTKTPGISEVSGKVWATYPIKKEIRKKIEKKDKKDIQRDKLDQLKEKERKIESDKLDILLKEKDLKMKKTEEQLMNKKAKLIKQLEEELNAGD